MILFCLVLKLHTLTAFILIAPDLPVFLTSVLLLRGYVHTKESNHRVTHLLERIICYEIVHLQKFAVFIRQCYRIN